MSTTNATRDNQDRPKTSHHADSPVASRSDSNVRTIVIIGGGFAGVSTAMELGRLTRRDPNIQVHFVSDENYFVFQPMLPEVVSCSLEPSHILNPIRQLCRHVNFHCATVQNINLDENVVTIVGYDARRIQTLVYDHLVLCPGLTINLSRTPGMAEHSLPIKTLGDAFHLRNHVISRLEEADIEPDSERQERLLTFVCVGGGFSGVETLAELNDMIKSVLRFYPRAQAAGHRAVLIHSRDRILNELGESLAKFAERKLAQRGVEIILNTRLEEVTDQGIVLSDGRQISAGTVVSSVGNAPHPLVLNTNLPAEKGRVLTDEYLRVKNSDTIWSLGDTALVPDIKRGGFCPPTAQYAMRQGKRCARNILATIHNKPVKPFVFGGLGQLAVIGHRAGVAEIMGVKIAGILAWFLWRSIYLTKLPGLRAKVRVGLDWALDVVFPRDIAKIDVQRTEALNRAHYRKGESIIKQGEIGDKFYIIESGEVEVIREKSDHTEQQLAVRTTGESFGEIALLKDTPRTATVRCLTPVDVITFSRNDFKSLVGSYAALRTQVESDVQAIVPPTTIAELPNDKSPPNIRQP
jgi:NADH:quinone reductase (non-electrogenic)